MEQIIFQLDKVPDRDSKFTRLAAYQEIKKKLFELAPKFYNGEMNVSRFHREFVEPNVPAGIKVDINDTRKWYRTMQKYTVDLVANMKAREQLSTEKTLLEKERDKIIKQAEIRQDVTDIMSTYIQSLKDFVNNPEKMQKLTHKEMMDMYKVIREEEDRARALGIKERSEDRADAAFAFFVSQARAGQLEEDDIEFMENDVKQTLNIFKNENGVYQIPQGRVPKIQSSAKNRIAEPAQSGNQGA